MVKLYGKVHAKTIAILVKLTVQEKNVGLMDAEAAAVPVPRVKNAAQQENV